MEVEQAQTLPSDDQRIQEDAIFPWLADGSMEELTHDYFYK